MSEPVYSKANCGRWPRDPSYPCMARNLFRAGVRIVSAAATGERVRVSEEIAQKRLSICKACKYFDNNRVRCKLCGCRMGGVVGKVQWATEQCPASPPKWKAVK